MPDKHSSAVRSGRTKSGGSYIIGVAIGGLSFNGVEIDPDPVVQQIIDDFAAAVEGPPEIATPAKRPPKKRKAPDHARKRRRHQPDAASGPGPG